MPCLPGQMEEEAKLEFNSKLASRRRQHRDDAIGDAGPRRLPFGQLTVAAYAVREVYVEDGVFDRGPKLEGAYGVDAIASFTLKPEHKGI